VIELMGTSQLMDQQHCMRTCKTTLPAMTVWIAVFCLMVAGGASQAQDCFDYSSSGLPLTAIIPTDDLVQDVVLHDDTLILIERGFGVHLFDVSIASAPEPLGESQFGLDLGDGAMAGDILLIADRGYGIYCVDIAQPEYPVVTDSLTFGQDIIWIETNGSLGACSDRDRNLILLDLSDPAHPVETSRVFLPASTTGIAFVSHYIYVTCGNSGLQIIDASDPTNPQIINSVTISGFCLDLAIDGNNAFILADGYGVFGLDISLPAQPEILSVAPIHGVLWGLAYAENRVFVAAGLDGLAVIDASDPENLAYRGTEALQSNCFEVVANKTHTFAACSYGGVFISDYEGASFAGFIDAEISYAPNAIAANDGRYMYLASDDHGIQVVDLNDPDGPKTVATLATPGVVSLVALDGNTLVTHSDIVDILVVDVSDPLSPVISGVGVGAGGSAGIAVGAGVALSLHPDEGISCFDISNPASTVLASITYVPEEPTSILMAGNYCIVTLRGPFSGLQVIDFSDPYSPVTIDWVYVPGGITEVTATEEYLLAIGDDWKFHVVDFSVPGSLSLLTSLPMENKPISLTTEAQTVYIQNNTSGMDIMDISDPLNPMHTGIARFPMLAISMQFGGGYIVSHSAKYGISLLPLQCASGGMTPVPDPVSPWVTTLVEAYPNPFNPRTTVVFTLADSGSANLEIINIRGRIVRTLVAENWLAAGEYQFIWDGTNDDSQDCPSGIYFAQVRTHNEASSKKITLIR
jgi:hypothetical protein